MSYKALYLKYRPQTFEEVAGQEAIVRTLKNALANDKLAHAYLFAGPRGTGKTTMARLLAKALDCSEGIGHQCNHCENCVAITEGTHPDVIEIDAASNNGVDQVRELIEKVNYAPIKGRYKVYIIDEVHMMTDAAFNALLKTIEEPPERVIFILCTTEPYKVLPTILSRCQRFDFGKIPEEEMKAKLADILQKEGVSFDEKSLPLIVRLADGGMRDALSILDQVIAYSGSSLHQEDVLAMFGLASDEEKIDLLVSLKKGDVSRVVGKSEAYLASGIDIRRLVSELIGFLKDLLIYEKTKTPALMDSLNEQEARELSRSLGPKDCNRMLQKLVATQNDFKNVSDIRALFELALLQMATDSNDDEPVKPAPVIAKPEPKPEPKPELKPEPKPEPKTEVKPEPKPAPAPKVEEKPVEDAPDWLLAEDHPIEESKPKASEAKPAPTPKPQPVTPIDTSSITRPNIATSGTAFHLEDDQLFSIMVLANRNERTELVKNWDRLDPLRLDPKFGALASLLYEGKPYALSAEAMILSYRFTTKAELANLVANQEPLEQLAATLIGRKVFIYAIDPDVQTRVRGIYFSKMQLGKLPKRDEVKLVLPKI